jgi:hypothetical protein
MFLRSIRRASRPLNRLFSTHPEKARDQMPIWMEFNQLAVKYNALNLCHGTPGIGPPKFLIDNLMQVCTENDGA